METVIQGLVVVSCLLLAVVPTFADNPLSMITNRIPKLRLAFDKIEHCQDFPDTVIQLDEFTLTQTGINKFLANGKVKMSRTVDEPLSVSIEMYKCASKDDASSCQFFLSLRKSGFCKLLRDSKSGWKQFIKNTDFPKSCPFAAKVYHINNATLDFKDLASFPMFQSSWKVKAKYYQEKELLGCTEIGLTTYFATDY